MDKCRKHIFLLWNLLLRRLRKSLVKIVRKERKICWIIILFIGRISPRKPIYFWKLFDSKEANILIKKSHKFWKIRKKMRESFEKSAKVFFLFKSKLWYFYHFILFLFFLSLAKFRRTAWSLNLLLFGRLFWLH